jgi:nascent polypeptide-associated complex subunit alpha
MDARGQETYQVVGSPEEREAAGGASAETETEAAGESAEPETDIPEEDVEIVAQRTGVSREEAREALEAADGDLATAIGALE